jgi:hypothetical protein
MVNSPTQSAAPKRCRRPSLSFWIVPAIVPLLVAIFGAAGGIGAGARKFMGI